MFKKTQLIKYQIILDLSGQFLTALFCFNPFRKNNQYLNKNSVGFDLGCGSGRFALHIADKVKNLHCIEPSAAIDVAKKLVENIRDDAVQISLSGGTALSAIPDDGSSVKIKFDEIKCSYNKHF